MTQTERRLYLISELLKEQPRYEGMKIPESEDGQKRLLRSLFNIRMPRTASQEFLAVQDAYLQEETRHRESPILPIYNQCRRGFISGKGILRPCAVTRL